MSSAAIMTWTPTTNIHRLWIEVRRTVVALLRVKLTDVHFGQMAAAGVGNGIIVTALLTALIASVPNELMAVSVAASFLARSIGKRTLAKV